MIGKQLFSINKSIAFKIESEEKNSYDVILSNKACTIVCVNGKCYCKEEDTADDHEKHK